MKENIEKEYMCIVESLCLQQRLAQPYKSIIRQFKKKRKEKSTTPLKTIKRDLICSNVDGSRGYDTK